MIGAANNEIISFRLTSFSINSFTDSIVTKVSGDQRLDANIYYATM